MPRNHADHTPAAVLVLDTETKRTPTAAGEDQTMRLWCARYVLRRKRGNYKPRDEQHWGNSAEQLAQTLDKYACNVMAVWCYCHNLGYDLQSSGLLEHMSYRGWSISAVSAVSRYLWAVLAKHN